MKAQRRLGLAMSWPRITSAFLLRERLGKDARAGLNPLIGRQLEAVRASLPAPVTRPPLVVPARALREDEQLVVRVGPSVVGAAPQHSMRPAKESDELWSA